MHSIRMQMFLVSIVIFAASCATAPNPTTMAPQAEMAKAREQRAFIKDNGLETYAPESFAKAEDAFLAAEKVYGNDDDKAREQLAIALPLYDQTVSEGFPKKIAGKKALADSARTTADGAKAKIAASTVYVAAEEAYTRAGTEAAGGQSVQAVASYEEAEKKYIEAATLAEDARLKAQAAMESADASIESTTERIKSIDEEMNTAEGGLQ